MFREIEMASKHVVCAVSGGVDSAIAVHLLLKSGFRVTGCFMKNWNREDEITDSATCKMDLDEDDARYVCEHFRVPFLSLDFSKSYWNQVFCRFLDEYERGFTPNPDILCNKYIKFPMLMDYCKAHLPGVDFIATGHYARLRFDQTLQKPRLLKGVDELKDQTFFLSQIEPSLLDRILFPVGDFTKLDVRRMARELGLERVFDKRSSVGICFIGKRNFNDFIDQYLPKRVGEVVDLESGERVGEHTGIHHYTIGQRIPLEKTPKPYYIAKKDFAKNIVYAVKGTNHPALYHDEFIVERPHWICEDMEQRATAEGGETEILDDSFQFKFQTRHYQTPIEYLRKTTSSHVYRIKTKHFFRGIAPGQFAVLYNNEECLGSAKILRTTRSLHELGYDGPAIENSDQIFVKKYLNRTETLDHLAK